MTASDSDSKVASFFDVQASDDRYRSLKALTEAVDHHAADLLNAEMKGDVLTIGGVWDYYEPRSAISSMTVVDVSESMLATYTPEGAIGLVGDLFDLDLAPSSFDSVVFPLMLHHLAAQNWATSLDRLDQAVSIAASCVRDGGRVLIYERCPVTALYQLQRLALPVSKRVLERSGQPLVIMHSLKHYMSVLRRHFRSVEATSVSTHGMSPWTMYPVFMTSSLLRIPHGLYPRPYVIKASHPLRRG